MKLLKPLAVCLLAHSTAFALSVDRLPIPDQIEVAEKDSLIGGTNAVFDEDGVFFIGDDGSRPKLWRYDEASGNTTVLSEFNVRGLHPVGNRVVFAVGFADTVMLWSSNGTEAGTFALSEQTNIFDRLTVQQGRAYVPTTNGGLLSTDGIQLEVLSEGAGNDPLSNVDTESLCVLNDGTMVFQYDNNSSAVYRQQSGDVSLVDISSSGVTAVESLQPTPDGARCTGIADTVDSRKDLLVFGSDGAPLLLEMPGTSTIDIRRFTQQDDLLLYREVSPFSTATNRLASPIALLAEGSASLDLVITDPGPCDLLTVRHFTPGQQTHQIVCLGGFGNNSGYGVVLFDTAFNFIQVSGLPDSREVFSVASDNESLLYNQGSPGRLFRPGEAESLAVLQQPQLSIVSTYDSEDGPAHLLATDTSTGTNALYRLNDSPDLGSDMSGLWNTAEIPNQGLSIHHGETSDRQYLFVTFYTQMDGAPLWLVGQADYENGQQAIDMPLQVFTGGNYFTSTASQGDEVGTLSLRRTGCNSIEIITETDPVFDNLALNLTRLGNNQFESRCLSE